MKTKPGNQRLNKTLTALCAAVIFLGFTTGSVLAHDDPTHYDNSKPPYVSPHKAEPPTGGHSSLAAAATNPIANLVQFQLQNTYNWENHNSSGYSNASVIQPVVPFKLPWESVPLLITRTTLPYVTTPDLGGTIDRQRGFGDTQMLLLATPKLETKGIQLGLGVNTVILPPETMTLPVVASGRPVRPFSI